MPPIDDKPGHTPPFTWIDSPSALTAWFRDVGDGDVVGVDTEFTRHDTFHAQLSLLQLAHHGRHALVDPLAFELGDTLREQLGEHDVTCVMHSAGEDIETLGPWLPNGPSTLFDTQLAAAFAGLGASVGYGALVERLCHVELDKGETRSDWNRRPLSASQQTYATLDVVYLEQLYRALSTLLEQQGHMAWFAADCERVKQRAENDAMPNQPHRVFRAAADWPKERQVLLRRLLLWRERRARELDKPRNWLIDNDHAMTLASHPPADANQLFEATRGLRALRGPQRGELLELLHAPVTSTEIADTRGIPPRPDPASRRAVRDMKQAVERLAGQLGVPSGLLCPRKALEALLADKQWPSLLQGWRRDQLEPVLAPWLADA